MAELRTISIGADAEFRRLLQERVDETGLAKIADAFPYPLSADDLTVRRIQESLAEIAFVDIPVENATPALRTVELLRAHVPKISLIAVGSFQKPEIIVQVMRLGACEFIDRSLSPASLREALERAAAARQQLTLSNRNRGTVFAFVNAKGGSGATTVAVNAAMRLQESSRSTVLVDLATLGNAAIQLGVTPSFSLMDVIKNLHRLDSTLLDGVITKCHQSLHLLAGLPEPAVLDVTASAVHSLFDLLAMRYEYVVVDASNRMDSITQALGHVSKSMFVVCHPDVPSLWSANKLRVFLRNGHGHDNVQLILNRFLKIPGLSDRDIEDITQTKIFWKIPNHYGHASKAIEKGEPVVLHNHSELSRALHGLAATLAGEDPEPARKGRLLFAWS